MFFNLLLTILFTFFISCDEDYVNSLSSISPKISMEVVSDLNENYLGEFVEDIEILIKVKDSPSISSLAFSVEFQPDFLARTLFTDKGHLSVDEGDAWSDEFRDLLDARLDVSIFLEPVKEKINDEVDETEAVRIPRAIQDYNKNIRIERGIKEAFIEYLLPNNPENKSL